MERKQAKALILVTENNTYMYLDSDVKENYYIDLFEEYGVSNDLDIDFPKEKGIYEIAVELDPTEDGIVATVLESKLVHNLVL